MSVVLQAYGCETWSLSLKVFMKRELVTYNIPSVLIQLTNKYIFLPKTDARL